MPARRCVTRIQPALIVRARALDAVLQIFRHRLALRLQPFELWTVDRFYRRIALHDADTRGRPAERKSGIESLARHGVVSGATRMIERKYNFRNRSAGHGLYHLSAGADDPFALRLHSHHEAGDVLKIDQRHTVPFRVLDEVGYLAGGLGVDNSGDARSAFCLEESAAIRNYSHRASKQPGVGAQQLRCMVRLEFQIIVAVPFSIKDSFNGFFDAV